jgi:hypothetical protein
VVLGEVKMRPRVGHRGLALGRSSRPRKAISGRGVETVRWRKDELK